MATKIEIITAIKLRVSSTAYSAWRIGLTHDLEERKNYWRDTKRENVNSWRDWTANSLSDTQDIEAEFIRRGMQGGTGDLSDGKTVYVYIF